MSPTREGTVMETPNPQRNVYNAVEFRAYDDDGELYSEGITEEDDESLESLFEWVQRDAGVTLLKIKVNGEWRDEIG